MNERCDISPNHGATPGLNPGVTAPGAPVCPKPEKASVEAAASKGATVYSAETRPLAPKAQVRNNSLLTRQAPPVRMSVQAQQLAKSNGHVERAEKFLNAGDAKGAQQELRQAMLLYLELKKTQADSPEVKQLGARIHSDGARWQGMRDKQATHREAGLLHWNRVYHLTAGSKDPQQQELHAKAREELRSNLLAGLEKRLPHVIAALEQQRSGGERPTSTHFRNEELLAALRYVVKNGAVVKGKRFYPVTIEEAIKLLPVAHQKAHEDFWTSPHIKEGWSVALPEEGGTLADGEARYQAEAAAGAIFTEVAVKGDVTEAKAAAVGIKTIHINGGTAQVPAGGKAAVGYRFVIGKKGGQVQLAHRMYTFPAADAERVVYVQRNGRQTEIRIKAGIQYSEDPMHHNGTVRVQKMGVTSGDANKQRLDMLERAADRLERLETADPDFYRHIQEFETQEGLKKMATPEAKREHLFEQAKADWHRSGSYDLAADKLKQILAPHIDKAIAAMSAAEIRTIVAEEQAKDSDLPLEQRIGERLLKFAFEKIDAEARYGRLDGYDKIAAQAWRRLDDIKDPLDKWGEVSDASLDQWTDMALLLGSAVLGVGGVENVLAEFPKAIPALAQRGAIGLSRVGGLVGGVRGAELAYELGQWALPRVATVVVAAGVTTPTMAATQELMHPDQIGWRETLTMGLTVFAQQLGANIILPGVGGLTLGRIGSVSQAASSPVGVIGTNFLSGAIVDAATAKAVGGNVEEEVLIGLLMTGAMAPWMHGTTTHTNQASHATELHNKSPMNTGVDEAARLRKVADELRSGKIDPDQTHIPAFAEQADAHLDAVEAGIRDQWFATDRAERLKILQAFRREAAARVKSGRVTYRWWVNFNLRLSILTTPGARRSAWRGSLEDPFITELYRTGDWVSDERLNERYRLYRAQHAGDDIELAKKRSYAHSHDLDAFPNRIMMPVISDLGLAAFNRLAGSRIHPVALAAGPQWADGRFMHPDEFFGHDWLHMRNEKFRDDLTATERLEFDEFNKAFARKVEALPPKERVQVELYYFLMTHEAPALNRVLPGSRPDEAQRLFKSRENELIKNGMDRSWFADHIDDVVNVRSKADVRQFLEEGSRRFDRFKKEIWDEKQAPAELDPALAQQRLREGVETPKADLKKPVDGQEEKTAVGAPNARMAVATEEKTGVHVPKALNVDPIEEKAGILANPKLEGDLTRAPRKDEKWFGTRHEVNGYLSKMRQFFAKFMPQLGADSRWRHIGNDLRRGLEPLHDINQDIERLLQVDGSINHASTAYLEKHPEFMRAERQRMSELDERLLESDNRLRGLDEQQAPRIKAIEAELAGLSNLPDDAHSERSRELNVEIANLRQAREQVKKKIATLNKEKNQLESQIDQKVRAALGDEIAPLRRDHRLQSEHIRAKLVRETEREIQALDDAEVQIQNELTRRESPFLNGRLTNIRDRRDSLLRGIATENFDTTRQLYKITDSRRERSAFYQADQALGRALKRARQHYRSLQIRLVSLNTNSHGAVKGSVVELGHADVEAYLDLQNPEQSFTRRPDGSPVKPGDLAYVGVTIQNRITGQADHVRVTSESELNEALSSRGWTEDGRPAPIANSHSLGHRLAPVIREELRAAGIAPNEPGLNVSVREGVAADGADVLHVSVVADSRVGSVVDLQHALRRTEARLSEQLGRPVVLKVWGIQNPARLADQGELIPLAVND